MSKIETDGTGRGRSRMLLRVSAFGLAALLLGACSGLSDLAEAIGELAEALDRDHDPDRPGGGPGDAFALPDDIELTSASLQGFDACDDLYDHLVEHALEQVGPWGLDGGGVWPAGAFEMAEGDDAVDMQASPDAGADMDDSGAPGAFLDSGDGDVSGTNVQEQGVDEPDRVKTDGSIVYVLTERHLRVLDVTDDEPVELSNLALGDSWGSGLLLHGDRLLVTSSDYGVVPFAAEFGASLPYEPAGGTTSMVLIDVADPTDPKLLERLTVDGRTVSSRMVDGVVRVVLSTPQGNLPWEYPQGSGLRAERAALEANRDLIRDSEVDDWLPYFVHETVGGRATDRPLLDCDRVAYPPEFAGLGMLSVLTVDLDGDLLPGDEALGVLAGGDTVYASAQRLYVATTNWVDFARIEPRILDDMADDVTTEIHAFDISDPSTTSYLASGWVPGTLLSQWSMSEHDGVLRVASTIGEAWWSGFGGGGEPSSSMVTVLEPDGGTLEQIGQVEGLGPTERIYAVRFMGDVGYVVTFRETDPLYTLDLADPTDPQVTGELKIMGYSAYLHPMGDDLLLGVGQDADEEGFTSGTQVSLFDVSDPADPQRIDTLNVEGGHSDVEHDHRAFLHWPATGLTVVPFEKYDYDPETNIEEVDSGALTFTVSRAEGIESSRTLSHLPLVLDDLDVDDDIDPERLSMLRWDHNWRAKITRSIVSGDRLFTVSDAGLAVHDLHDLDDLGWLRFGR